MVSLITTSNFFSNSHLASLHLRFPLAAPQNPRKVEIFNLVLGKKECSFGFLELKRGRSEGNSWSCGCTQSWEREGDAELEAEILGFMENSEKPDAFPTRRELEEAGRWDLVEAIRKRGGWFSLGWESEEEEENDREQTGACEIEEISIDIREFQRKVKSVQESGFLEEDEEGSSRFDSLSENSSQPASPSGRTL